jgi:hypothetical protein
MFPPYVPFLSVFAAFSLCMLTDGVRRPAAAAETSSLARRVVTGAAGAFGLAHVLRVAVATIMA